MSSILSDRDLQRFWSKVDKQPSHHLWTGNITRDGYGQFDLHRRKYGTHRVAMYIEYGHWPKNALHVVDCRIKHCVRIDHLYDGSLSENSIDSAIAGTHNKLKLSESDVIEIRMLYEKGVSNSVISVAYGLDGSTVRRIINREYWKRVI
jgi:hypothetical protein